ncbi:transcriptional regulator [Bradyrhizobium sp. TM239]|uniref:transcriptional regulator n=1 Tax=Bradyrhizobium sp. TM239 TaxID=2599802 RepID=UPI0030C68C81
MSARKSAELLPEGIARSNRKRLAAEQGMRALADVERAGHRGPQEHGAVLKKVREAKEAADEALRTALPPRR